jgi:peptidoglycan hydrolase-like protein with peptidoglycan-binding domain
MTRSPLGTSTSFFIDWTAEQAAPADADRPADARVASRSTGWTRFVARTRLVDKALWLRSRGRLGSVALVAAAAAITGVLLPGPTASADPSAHTWYRLRMCESSNNYGINTGNGYYGAYQFDLATWRSVGGHGYPNRAGVAEQDARALMLYRMRGWQPWTCASILGLGEDSDARSGRTADIKLGGTRPGSAKPAPVRHRPAPPAARPAPSGIPAFPGTRWYRFGDWNRHIKTFQDQMHARGYFPVGTGEYGPNTLKMVTRLQQLNGLIPNGFIGPNTWRLAWTGRYSAPEIARSSAIPAFPGTRWYRYGDWNRHIKTFQDQMHARGYFPVGTGQYGPNTLRMVKQLQRLNGLVPNGYIGPNTWRLAWKGVYALPG